MIIIIYGGLTVGGNQRAKMTTNHFTYMYYPGMGSNVAPIYERKCANQIGYYILLYFTMETK